MFVCAQSCPWETLGENRKLHPDQMNHTEIHKIHTFQPSAFPKCYDSYPSTPVVLTTVHPISGKSLGQHCTITHRLQPWHTLPQQIRFIFKIKGHLYYSTYVLLNHVWNCATIFIRILSFFFLYMSPTKF